MLSLWRKTLVLALAAGAALGTGACTDSSSPTAPTELQNSDNNSENLLTSYNPFKGIKVVGVWSKGTFVGNYTVLKFLVGVDGKLKAEVRLVGKLKTSLGVVVKNVDLKVIVPVNILKSSCVILKLELDTIVKYVSVNGKTEKLTLLKCVTTVDPAKLSLTASLTLKVILCDIAGALGGALHILVGLLNKCLLFFLNCLIC